MLILYVSGNIIKKTPAKLTLIADNKTGKTNIKPANCHQLCLTTGKKACKTLQTTEKKLYILRTVFSGPFLREPFWTRFVTLASKIIVTRSPLI